MPGDGRYEWNGFLPVLDLPPDRFEAVEFVPFRAAIGASVAAIMVAHLLVPAAYLASAAAAGLFALLLALMHLPPAEKARPFSSPVRMTARTS